MNQLDPEHSKLLKEQQALIPGAREENMDNINPHSVPLTEKLHKKISRNEKFFSLEFFPPKTFNGATNLMAIAGRIGEQGKPLFCDISWKSSPLTAVNSECQEPSTLIVAAALSDFHNLDVMMHIPSVHVTKSQVMRELQKAKDVGIRNILALRGVYDQESSVITDEDTDESDGGFEYTVDLVKFIRKEFDDYFTIAVAGYPRRCANYLDDYEQDIRHLKAKVDAGADFILTQMFFEAQTFYDFARECEKYGIQVPIIPGIMPIQSYATLSQLQHHSPVTVPEHLLKAIEPIKHDDSAVMKFGLKHAIDLSHELLDSGLVHGVHFYTLNRETVTTQVLTELGLCNQPEQHKEMDQNSDFLPWLKGLAKKRRGLESVRPIFWASRPRSYLIRTSKWDEFPNGRWGDSSAASFGELKDYHLFFLGNRRASQDLLNMWGAKLNCVEDVFDVFVCYLTGRKNKLGYKVTEMPWNEDEVALETIQLVDKLSHINKHGILTINSQPNVNCLPSTDPVVGWGQPGGYVFQKAYLEFFVRDEVAVALYKEIEEHYSQVNYHMVNCAGDEVANNAEACTAVTWGVFPGSEIIQPTVVDPVTFHLWKDEAFGLWKQQWGRLYPEGSTSRQLITDIHDSYYLVNLVDNDYVAGNCLFDILDSVLKKLGSV